MNFTADGKDFVHFDEYEDAVVAIELVGSQSVDVQNRPSQWKWVLIAMQNAVQGAMVLALSGTDGCGALAPKSQQRNRAQRGFASGPPAVPAQATTFDSVPHAHWAYASLCGSFQ
jgi:hypothetical protein